MLNVEYVPGSRNLGVSHERRIATSILKSHANVQIGAGGWGGGLATRTPPTIRRISECLYDRIVALDTSFIDAFPNNPEVDQAE